MDKILESLVVQSPGMVSLLLLVIIFLRYQMHRDAAIKYMHEEHLTARKETREAIKENTQVIRDNTSALQQLSDTVSHCEFKKV